jgi:hypothetical protein
MQWTRWGPAIEYLKGALTPLYSKSFRAVGFFYFHSAERAFGWDFPKYVAVIHVIHLFNVWVLWQLIRRLGAPVLAASLATAFFALHMALFDAVWKPMYVFDVLCATFCLLALLLWARGNWVLSFVSFWLAYKAKELAVMLPLVLLSYEIWFGSRRWAKLAPFLAGSLSFGLQALLLAPTQDSDYVFHFTRDTLARTASFYAGQVFLLPHLGFVLPLAAVTAPNRRTWFGLVVMALFFFPLLWLPGRVYSAYCYLPFAGLAITMAGLAEAARPAAIALFFLLWLPLDIHSLRVQRNDTLRRDADAREWITTFDNFAKTHPTVTGFVYRGVPDGFHPWGLESAVKYSTRRLDVAVPSIDSPEGLQLQQSGRAVILNWDPVRHKLEIQTPPAGSDNAIPAL